MGASIKRVKAIKLGAVLILLQLCATMALHAQVSGNHYHLQEKYWNYRERYKKLFVEIGSERNQGIPITNRFNYQYAAGKMANYVEPDCAADDNGTYIDGGDNPLRHMGNYMAILSTEIALLKLNNQPYNASMQELYFLIRALNRLDRDSDTYLESNLGPNLDGRFMRSDQNLASRNNWLEYDTTKYVNFKSYRSFTRIISAWGSSNCDPLTYEYKNIMSKDEILGALWGLAFVKKYVPNEFVHRGDGLQGFYLVDEAIAIASRIMGYLTGIQTYPKKCGLLRWDVSMEENWTILYPLVINSSANIDNTFKRDELIGNDFFAEIAPGMVLLGEYITGNSYSHLKTKRRTINDPNWPSLSNLCQNYDRTIDRTSRYYTINAILSLDRDNPLELAFMAMNPIGLAFLLKPDNAWDSANLNLEAGLLGPLSSTTAFSIMQAYKNEIRYELAYTQFRNLTPNKPASYWAAILDDAPACNHVSVDAVFNDYNTAYFGRRLFGRQHFGVIGYRNGSDFMLLYNLFHLQYLATQEPYFKMACDCEQRSTLFNGTPHTVTASEEHGDTKIQASNRYHDWGISIESYISKPVTINSAGKLNLVEFVTICTRNADIVNPNESEVHGTLEIGSSSAKGCLRVGNQTTLSVHDGGSIIVKSNSLIRVSNGGLLKAFNGGTVVVENNAKLIIEAGAELSLTAGAEIILAGSDAVLEIEGKLQLGANQQFSIGTQSSQTPGYIRFLPGAQVLAGSGAQMALGKANNFRKVLELAENAQISLPNTLTQFGISYGEVQMAPGSRLMVATKAVFVNARFERLGNTSMHHGVLLSGNHAHEITASRFNDATTGLEMNLNGNLKKPVLMVNQFNNNEKGLLVHGGGLLIGSGSFTGNTQWAMQLSALSKPTDVNNISFSQNANGIKISSANSHPIVVHGCNLQRSGQSGTGIEVIQGNVTIRNNTINNYMYGVQMLGLAAKVRLACNNISNASIAVDPINQGLADLSNQARNVLHDNYFAINANFGQVFLDEGWNDLSSGNSYDFFGDLWPGCFQKQNVVFTHGQESYFEIPANNNKFMANRYHPAEDPYLSYGSYSVGTYHAPFTYDHSCSGWFMVTYPTTMYPVFTSCVNCDINFISCAQAEPPWWHDVFNIESLDTDPTQWLVYSSLYPGIELKQAIRTALNDISYSLDQPQNDSLALERFKQILTANYSNMDEYGLSLLAAANTAMNYALTNVSLS